MKIAKDRLKCKSTMAKTDYDLKIEHIVPSEKKPVQEFCNRVMNRVYDWLEQSTPKTDARVTQVFEDARCIEAELKELHEYIGVLCETSVGADGTRMDNLEEFQFQQALKASITENVDKDSISNESQVSEPSEEDSHTEASDDNEAVTYYDTIAATAPDCGDTRNEVSVSAESVCRCNA